MAATILIVEDEEDLVDILQIWLSELGYQTEVAGDGMEALRKFRKLKPQLVLLDVALPIIDGFEVLKTIKSDPELSQTPVIMLTAKGDIGSVNFAKRLNADGYLIKPVVMKDLFDLIQSKLSGKAAD